MGHFVLKTVLNPIFMYAPTRKKNHSWPVNVKKDLGEVLQCIFIFHGYKKKTQQTPHAEIDATKNI